MINPFVLASHSIAQKRDIDNRTIVSVKPQNVEAIKKLFSVENYAQVQDNHFFIVSNRQQFELDC